MEALLVGKSFVVKTNNVATSYFSTQPKLSPKQAWWKDFLVEFDMTIEYRSGKLNYQRCLKKEGTTCNIGGG
jgi:hypothetical protein